MEGIRDYLPEQNVTPLDKAITQVQSEHSSDAANFADILSLALYKFQVTSKTMYDKLAKLKITACCRVKQLNRKGHEVYQFCQLI